MDLRYLDIPELRLKYYVFGSGGSPRVLITAAIHGDEVTGAYTAYKLINYLKTSERVKGTVTVVPVVNVLGFIARTRFNPIDYVDMNRVFPEGAGSLTTRKIVRFIWEIASSSDYVLDLHCAGLNSYQYVLALYREFSKVREFTDRIPWDTVVESTGTRGQLFIEATHIGIPAAIIETGGGSGYYSVKWGEALFNSVIGTLSNIGVLSSESPASSYLNRKYYGRLVHVKTPVEGFLTSTVEPGAFTRKGDLLGEVGGFPIYSPTTGRVIRVDRDVFLPSEDSVASIAPLEE
ncbi:MAG: succinylglutamate desuccinylase/aspartoacylase family protein [Sulfolobales archaeon]|nr:succinylglutamate desuccinylase/aspartoacylase family protein [Sulfolobales archaeon]MDW8082209.1 succinylglutamate desuccinylase/aspartoacylase family protein [Sulfolobales archaeon]